MTSHLILDISQTDMITLFDSSDLIIRDYRKEDSGFYIELRHSEETNGAELLSNQLNKLAINGVVKEYNVPELCKRYW